MSLTTGEMSAADLAAVVGNNGNGDSEFLEAITDKNPEDIWMVMDELMSTLQALNPRLYQATMDRIKQ